MGWAGLVQGDLNVQANRIVLQGFNFRALKKSIYHQFDE